MSAVPANIHIEWEGPDIQGRIRAFAKQEDQELGAATAVPDDTNPGAWVISDMHFSDPAHWPSLGQTLLNRLVDHIEEISPGGSHTVITASLDNLLFRREIERFGSGSRITYERG